MLKTILAISGKPGLYKLVSRGNRNFIVESVGAQRRRLPVFGGDRIISLADIAMYTNDEEVPLASVLAAMKKLEDGKVSSFDYKNASKEQLAEYLAKVLPNFDRDRVFPSDIKKLVQWYNLLVENDLSDFEPVTVEQPEAQEAETETPE
ncbi:MAG: DUF5606 domain-containing protein [Bacteroidales bacterium]|nr:DUF5606 domain-containing protein [Candidatus Physcousia equi]